MNSPPPTRHPGSCNQYQFCLPQQLRISPICCPQVPDGFIAHVYAVCEQISPVLAWGFLGPKSSLHDFCCFFKVTLSLVLPHFEPWVSSASYV